VRSAPPVTLHLLGFPLRALKQTFSPQHLRQCYLTRSSQIRMPRGTEHACLLFPCGRRCVDFPSYPHLTMLPFRNRLGEPYLPQESSPLKLYCATSAGTCQLILIWLCKTESNRPSLLLEQDCITARRVLCLCTTI